MNIKQGKLRQQEQPPRDRLIRRPEVQHVTSLGKSTIYALMREVPPAFPLCRKTGPRSVAWSEREILEWVESRKQAPNARRSAATGSEAVGAN